MAELNNNAPPARSMKTFYLLILVFVLPFTTAVLLHFFDLKPSGKSHGTLIAPPISLQFPALKTQGGKDFTSKQWLKKWAIVMVDDTACDQPCQTQVHLLKQMHTSLNKEIKRVQRVLILRANTNAQTMNELQKQYPDLVILTAEKQEAAPFFNTFNVAGSHVYLVDPLGNLMMHYPDQFDLKGLRQDLTRLLKNSWAG